ncbi:MAG: NaeI family type II restriction endonuclease [Marmoricola sp.]
MAMDDVSFIDEDRFDVDPGRDLVAATWLEHDPRGERTAAVFRATYDQLYDGQHTGRFEMGASSTRPRRLTSARCWKSIFDASSAISSMTAPTSTT